MKRILIIAIAMALTGCASMQQAIGGYQTAAITGIQAANDNLIAGWSAAACATPFSAAVRNPQIIPALRVLCVPGGAGANATTLLDSVPPAK